MATPVPLGHIHTTRTNCPTGHEGRAAPPEKAYERPFCPATKPLPLHLSGLWESLGPRDSRAQPLGSLQQPLPEGPQRDGEPSPSSQAARCSPLPSRGRCGNRRRPGGPRSLLPCRPLSGPPGSLQPSPQPSELPLRSGRCWGTGVVGTGPSETFAPMSSNFRD